MSAKEIEPKHVGRFAALQAGSEMLRATVGRAAEEEAAAMRIMAVVGIERWAFVLAEVDRREVFFEDVRVSTPLAVCPRLAALESVYHDVIRGWLA